MPNQFMVETDIQLLARQMGASRERLPQADSPWSAHIYKTDPAPVVTGSAAARSLQVMNLGFMPTYGKALKDAHHNIRSESVAEKPTFRDAFRHQRCLVPMYSFCEWADDPPNPKWLADFAPPEKHQLAAAGIWTRWQSPNGDTSDTFGLITRAAPDQLSYLGLTRIPVMLPSAAWDAWLDAAQQDAATLEAILANIEPIVWVVSKADRSPRKKGPPKPSPASDPKVKPKPPKAPPASPQLALDLSSDDEE